MEWLVIALLAAWLAVTVIYQLRLRRLMPVMTRWDVFRVVPRWHLYPEVPHSLRLYYRDRDAAGQAGEWREIPLRCCNLPGHAIFNPELFAPDAVSSLIEFLCDTVRRADPPPPERLRQTVGLQGVWLRVANEPQPAGTTERQLRGAPADPRSQRAGGTGVCVGVYAPATGERSRMTDLAWLHDPWACVELTTRLAGVSVAFSAAEWLAARRAFADDAILGWPLLRQRSRLRGDGPVAQWLGGMFRARGFTAVQVIRL